MKVRRDHQVPVLIPAQQLVPGDPFEWNGSVYIRMHPLPSWTEDPAAWCINIATGQVTDVFDKQVKRIDAEVVVR